MKYLFKVEGFIFLILLVMSFLCIYTLIRFIIFPLLNFTFWHPVEDEDETLLTHLHEMLIEVLTEIKADGLKSFINSWIKY